MDIFEKLAKLSGGEYDAEKWIYLFVGYIVFFTLLLVLKPSRNDFCNVVKFSCTTSFNLTAGGFAIVDIIYMANKVPFYDAGRLIKLFGVLITTVFAILLVVGFAYTLIDSIESYYNKFCKKSKPISHDIQSERPRSRSMRYCSRAGGARRQWRRYHRSHIRAPVEHPGRYSRYRR